MILLFGKLTASESLSYLIVTNKLESSIISIPSPFYDEKYIDLYITLDKETDNDVYISNDFPYITCNISLNARVLSANDDINYLDEDNLSIIQTYASSYVKSQIEDYLYKTAKEFKSDISLFGKYAASSFSTLDEWNEYNWNDNFSNSFFNVNAQVTVISSYLIS